ncbi:Transmembrane protein C2orf18 [Cyphomyrmex costatus]|uniref:Transmembrane protein C2orf18 n=1 Tax=Cyphomyrmex costatus TaxID=456900 RepID=A0A195C2A0_9HYME|nr:Transmembrane protein C2orf18 [Cyphomyrmex costatus]
MAWSNFQCTLALLQIITGSFNTLSVKFADQQVVLGEDGQLRYFNHPFMQSLFMFLGEALCFLAFKICYSYYNRRGISYYVLIYFQDGSVDNNVLTKGSRIFNPFILIVPALCDMFATSIMYVGLNMTYASSFQMLRGSVIVFTGMLSIGFLNKKLGTREWIGISLVVIGLIFVGLSDILVMEDNDVSANSVITGDLLIIFAQIITAVQMVVEEKYVGQQDIPALQAIGWEGIFGFIGISLAIIPLNYITAPPPFADNSRGTLEATVEALNQIGSNSKLLIAVIGIAFSIAFFNFAGISVTKEMSATTRMILDSVRTIVIWIFSLALKHYLIGFIILLIGMACYNNLVIPQLIRKYRHYWGRHTSENEDCLINTAADDVQETI